MRQLACCLFHNGSVVSVVHGCAVSACIPAVYSISCRMHAAASCVRVWSSWVTRRPSVDVILLLTSTDWFQLTLIYTVSTRATSDRPTYRPTAALPQYEPMCSARVYWILAQCKRACVHARFIMTDNNCRTNRVCMHAANHASPGTSVEEFDLRCMHATCRYRQ
jgi:hypothetical protein